MIQYHNISINYNNKTLLSNFSLNIQQHQRVVFYGASGGGKSSLMAILLGFVQPTSGYILIKGERLTEKNIPEIRQCIAWLPQDTALPYEFVDEMINAPFQFKANKSQKPEKQIVVKHLAQLGLPESIYTKHVNQISGGERQRIMLATTFLLNKELVLLDEPTSGLDPESVNRVIDYLQHFTDKTIIAVSHDERFIQSFNQQIKIG